MSSLSAESTPLLAGLGLSVSFLLVVGLAITRDPATVVALEAEEGLATAESAVPTSNQDELARPQPAQTGAPSATSPFASAAPYVAPAAPMGLEQANTVAALKALLVSNPDDEQVLIKLARTEAVQPNGLGDAMTSLKALFRVSPPAAADKELGALVLRAAESKVPAHQEAAFALLSDNMGSVGPDLLFELSNRPAAAKTAKAKALEFTKRDEVRKLASASLRVALDLRDKSGCERAKLFAQAGTVGDRRSLPYLTPLNARKGCGFLSMADCYSCLGGRTELNKAISAINAR